MFDFTLADARTRILEGRRIVPVMTPDPSLGESYINPLPSYEESYPLRAICLIGERFWGLTGGTNLPHQPGKGIGHETVFGYTNSAPLYFSMPSHAMAEALKERRQPLNLGTLRQYSRFRFVTRLDAQAVWDGATPDRFDAVRDAIEAGSLYRLVFEDEGGVVYSLDVDLPMYFPETGSLTINTAPCYFPDFCGDPESLIQALTDAQPDILKDSAPVTMQFSLRSGVFGGFFTLRSDGSYYGVNDLLRDAPRRWRQARLYAY
jgi:hypothetical protein